MLAVIACSRLLFARVIVLTYIIRALRYCLGYYLELGVKSAFARAFHLPSNDPLRVARFVELFG